MSFYGSTYCQFIDNFSKIILNNVFNENNNIPNTSIPLNPIYADEKDDVLTLSRGNKWIVLENGSNNNEIKFSHNASNHSHLNTKIGMSAANSILQSGDIIESFTFQCDEAGHVIPETIFKTQYQLPEFSSGSISGNIDSIDSKIINNKMVISMKISDETTE